MTSSTTVHEEIRPTSNQQDVDLGNLPIQWNPKKANTGMTIKELNFQYPCNAAISGIKRLVPAQYRPKLMELIAHMFHSGRTYKVKVDIMDSFKDTDHWTLFKYKKLLKAVSMPKSIKSGL